MGVTALSSSAPKSRRAFVQSVGGAAAVGVATTLGGSPALAGTPPTGAKAPQFQLPSSRGEGETSLDDLTKSGKWTVRV